jgi:hypothetical protein
VAALSRQVVPIFSPREGNTLVDEPFDRAASMLHDETRRARIIEMTSGIEGVANVRFDGVLTVKNGRDPALRPR